MLIIYIIGIVGNIKPTCSWSWFIESNESEISKWIEDTCKKFEGSAEDMIIYN